MEMNVGINFGDDLKVELRIWELFVSIFFFTDSSKQILGLLTGLQ